MHKSLVTILAILVTVACSFGQDRQFEKKLDELLSSQFKHNEPGCEILVAKDGRIIYPTSKLGYPF